MNEYNIRPIRPEDAERTLDIYAPYITDSCISFEYEVPSLEEWLQRISTITQKHAWLVCEYDGEIIGYAYAGQHRARTAYQWSVESAVYIDKNFVGKGAGKLLYQKLFEALKQQGYATVFAGMTLPNEKSEALHKSCGFTEIGVFKHIGYKFDKWHDVKWMQLNIKKHTGGM